MGRKLFNQENDRVDYGELLTAEAGFELEQAVGMTYSLDMEALMGIPLCLGMGGEMSSGQRNNPLYVLEAIRRTGKKISIFCNAGSIKVPKAESRLFALLEESIHEVRMPKSTFNFHPKLWILQYHNIQEEKTMIKVVVLSRNLTFDQSLDVAVEMTGYVGSEVNPKNQSLADMLTFVSQFDSKKNAYRKLISNVEKVEEFTMMDCFTDYEFHSFGIYGRKENGIKKVAANRKTVSAYDLFKNCRSLFIVSPFLSESVISELLKNSPKNRCLITREMSVAKGIFEAFDRTESDGIWVVDPVFSSNDAFEDGDVFGYANRDVHAKVYYVEEYGEPNKLFIGSLNASANAFNYNVEFLLELKYGKNYTSYNNVKTDFIPEEYSPFIQMTEFNEEVTEQNDDVDFRDEVYGIIGAKVIAKEENFTIEVYVDKDYEGVTIRPFFVKTQKAQLKTVTEFENIPLNCLSNMFILGKDGAECLIRLEVEGFPSEERDDAVFNEVISNKSMLMNYMRYLLDEDFYDSVSLETLLGTETEQAEGNNETYGYTINPDVYEKMLRAAADNPERFDSMYEIIERLDDDKTDGEFKKLLDTFMTAAGRKGKSRK